MKNAFFSVRPKSSYHPLHNIFFYYFENLINNYQCMIMNDKNKDLSLIPILCFIILINFPKYYLLSLLYLMYILVYCSTKKNIKGQAESNKKSGPSVVHF